VVNQNQGFLREKQQVTLGSLLSIGEY
jgi:hypothetical protein